MQRDLRTGMRIEAADADEEAGGEAGEDKEDRQEPEPSFQIARRADLLVLNLWADVRSATTARVASHYRYRRAKGSKGDGCSALGPTGSVAGEAR